METDIVSESERLVSQRLKDIARVKNLFDLRGRPESADKSYGSHLSALNDDDRQRLGLVALDMAEGASINKELAAKDVLPTPNSQEFLSLLDNVANTFKSISDDLLTH